jgi:uncharacterized membrane protein YagU involved in acid resistance
MKLLRKRRPNPWLGAGAGLIGGLAGSFAIGGFHHLWAKATHSNLEEKGMESTTKAATFLSRKVMDRELDEQTKPKAASAVHFAFGSLVGAAYGAAAAVDSKFSEGLGIPFGASVYVGAHATSVPALGLSEPPTKAPLKDEVGEFLGHLVYGLVTDVTRRLVLVAAKAL